MIRFIECRNRARGRTAGGDRYVGAPPRAPSGRASPAPTKPVSYSGPLCTRDRIYEMDH